MSTETATESPTRTATPVLEVDGLSVSFAVDGRWVPAAVDVSYRVAPGEVLAIVGESGSGKSVSSMALLGLLPRNAKVTGSAKLQGQELLGARAGYLRSVRGRDMAIIFQEPMTALNPVYTIGFQIVETIRTHSDRSPAEARARAIELLGLVELPDPERAFRSYPHQLSGGQRQRAMIAQALALDPALLIADEPTTALDVTVQAEILNLMLNLRDKLDSAIILITHDMGVVAEMADRILVMNKGRIVEEGTADEIFYRPQHTYTQQLLGAVPRLRVVDGEPEAAPAPGPEERPTLAPILRLVDVAIEYPKQGRTPAFRAVEGANLEIYPGEVVGLVGESGSGKTTIGRAAVGLLPIVEGTLDVAGVDLTRRNRTNLIALRRTVGMVFQDPASSLNPRQPIGDSIGEPLLLAHVAKRAELHRRVEDLLDQVELPRSYRNRYPHELSGGQKQRVGIARALALSPELLVADEPTSALDVSVQARVLDLFQELQRELKFSCLFVTHDLAVVDVLASRIAVMQNGRIVEQGTRDQILRHPQDPYTQRLINAVPVPDPELQRQRRLARSAG